MKPRPSGRPPTALQRLGDSLKTLSIFGLAVLGIVGALLPMIIWERLVGRHRSPLFGPGP